MTVPQDHHIECHLGFDLPDRIARLNHLAYDLWWIWHDEAREVFRQLDYPLWRLTAHNPVKMLRLLPRERLEEAARNRVPGAVRPGRREARGDAPRHRLVVDDPRRAAGRESHRLLLG
jgi:hypothetical protein